MSAIAGSVGDAISKCCLAEFLIEAQFGAMEHDFVFDSKRVKLICRQDSHPTCAGLFFTPIFEVRCAMLEGYCDGREGPKINGNFF
ncbi:uncharacterized protein L969DRAFT_85757 [Mixia osmundae IAM 14324]|uniref:uncharacterized protein n=1 Tax=Mixia osmundae (strain CBS 9802 / IAM 14324 / JCM 22182 / KY 12970) TaxID=764103 RepID=UPI0004A54C24|nr:uncharacterized protein L969DRAFT_85757 [Mixia osmundae IAM 14324]KEI40570.1 hypothetical protein L969DRAFT_85757 [Mixia osmundae IAM 14324]